MENVVGFNQWTQIIKVKELLLEGQESAVELRNQLVEQSNASLSDDHQALRSSLIEKMMSTFDKTIKIAKQISVEGAHHQQQISIPPSTHFQLESPRSLVIGSTSSENSNPDLRPCKRRKPMPRWTKIVQVSPGKSASGLEGSLEDGFSWRKYGQKDILGAKFPRGYYRCTHRPSKGCGATKQVQRSDEDGNIYQVMYRGEHTCLSGPQHKQTRTRAQPKTEVQSPPSPQEQKQSSQSLDPEVFVGLSPEGDLKVEPEEAQIKAQLFRCFSFTTALLEPEPVDNFLSCSVDFVYSPTSDSSFITASPYQVTGPGMLLHVQTSESDTNDPLSGPNSVNNSPSVDFEFHFDQLVELDPSFF